MSSIREECHEIPVLFCFFLFFKGNMQQNLVRNFTVLLKMDFFFFCISEVFKGIISILIKFSSMYAQA